MTADERLALANLQKSIDAIAGGVSKLSVEVLALGARLHRHSDSIADTRKGTSQVGNELTDLKAGVISTVANLEKSIARVQSQLAADTRGQNIELAEQTTVLQKQSAAIVKFDRAPRRTALAGFLGVAAANLLWEFGHEFVQRIFHLASATGHS